jgi:hypothetical protein
MWRVINDEMPVEFYFNITNFYIKISSDRIPVNQDSYISVFLNATLFQYDGPIEEIDTYFKKQNLEEELKELPSFIGNGEQVQLYFQDQTINQMLKTIYD